MPPVMSVVLIYMRPHPQRILTIYYLNMCDNTQVCDFDLTSMEFNNSSNGEYPSNALASAIVPRTPLTPAIQPVSICVPERK